MRRREFVTLISRSERMRRIGVLTINADRSTRSTVPVSRSLCRGLHRLDGPRNAISKSTVATPLAMSSACVSSQKNS